MSEQLEQPSLPEYVCHIRKVFHSWKVFPILARCFSKYKVFPG
jgi:hypothetical protein